MFGLFAICFLKGWVGLEKTDEEGPKKWREGGRE
jgi:hypothetical protein